MPCPCAISDLAADFSAVNSKLRGKSIRILVSLLNNLYTLHSIKL